MCSPDLEINVSIFQYRGKHICELGKDCDNAKETNSGLVKSYAPFEDVKAFPLCIVAQKFTFFR